ncbi:MAG: tetratricopeptide repeat protein [Treponema sp.]|jgi:tetratricopeptide (TPR) repeat protein|nr:tetratricopeptide repeat protein [Treponema sp.]
MKRFAQVCFLLILTARYGYTNDFTDELQWLTVVTACIGQYNMAQTGDYTVKDPQDYYRPSDIREWLARQSGSRTTTATFYGICFDYAQWAYNTISQDRSQYERLGMKQGGWYIAGVGDNPRQITLYDPAARDKATVTMNGVPLKENSRQNVRAHSDAKNHAWLWVYGNDGTIYWLDPTWTDNTGYVWWGIVQNGEETQIRPSAEYCMVTLPNAAAFEDLTKGYANYQYEMTDLSIADYTAALEKDPNNALIYSNRGVAYADISDYDRAFADCNRAIELAPNLSYVYYNRGVAYYYRSDKNYYDRAIADFSQAIRLDPYFALAYHRRGLMYTSKTDFDRAVADLTQAISLSPSNLDAYNSRGVAYRRRGDASRSNEARAADYNRAVADFEVVLRVIPNDVTARSNLVMIRRARGY